MKRLPTILLACAAIVVASLAGTGIASAAAPTQNTTCSGSWATGPGMLTSGTYGSVTVSGVCLVTNGQTITIRGGITLQPGAQLVAISGNTMSIYGNIVVGQGAVLGLGCSSALISDGGCDAVSQDVVRGNILANNALSIYLNGDTVYGNVSFIGGGWGADCTDPGLITGDPHDPLGHSLAVKDNVIHGNVTLQGWAGCWIGFIRNTVHGVVTIADNYANQAPFDPNTLAGNAQGPDSTEVATNTIWGALNCSGNTPAAQLGDSGGSLNTVHGSVTGECLALLA